LVCDEEAATDLVYSILPFTFLPTRDYYYYFQLLDFPLNTTNSCHVFSLFAFHFSAIRLIAVTPSLKIHQLWNYSLSVYFFQYLIFFRAF